MHTVEQEPVHTVEPEPVHTAEPQVQGPGRTVEPQVQQPEQARAQGLAVAEGQDWPGQRSAVHQRRSTHQPDAHDLR